jgi:monothiol glutaredoxin
MFSVRRAAAASLGLFRGPLVQNGGVSLSRFGQRAGIITAGDETDSHDDFKPKVKAEKATQTVQEHIEQDIEQNPVMVYMKGVPEAPQCGFSAMVVRILKEYDVSYSSRNVLADPELREGIKQFSRWPTIPQVFINGEFVGGSDIVINMHRTGELEKLLEQTKLKQSKGE